MTKRYAVPNWRGITPIENRIMRAFNARQIPYRTECGMHYVRYIATDRDLIIEIEVTQQPGRK